MSATPVVKKTPGGKREISKRTDNLGEAVSEEFGHEEGYS